MSSLFLDDTQIFDLTKRYRHSAQAKVLRFLGIIHDIRPDGSIVVLKEHVDKKYGGGSDTAKPSKRTRPNMESVC